MCEMQAAPAANRGEGRGMVHLYAQRSRKPSTELSVSVLWFAKQKELMFTIVSPAVRVPTCQAGGGIRNSVRRHVHINEERETVRYFCLRFGCASQNVQYTHGRHPCFYKTPSRSVVVLSVSPGGEAEREV